MSLSPIVCDNSPEPSISNVCKNLETQFMEDLSKAEGMRVFARVRPMLNSELEAGNKECIGTIDDQTVRAVVPSSSVKYKSSSHLSQDITEDFKFTAAYGPEVGQFVFFEESMMNTMQNFIEGQNSLVFSYGITGSGKTFTLQGDVNHPGIIPLSLHLFFASVENQLLDRIVVKPDKFSDVTVLNDNEIKEEYQIIEQLLSTNNQEEWSFRNTSKKSLAMVLCDTFSDKFESEGLQTTLGPEEMAQAQAAAFMKELGKKSAGQQTGYCSVWVSFAEIYNEYIYDLLQPNVNQRTKLTLGEDKNGDVYVKGLREVCVFSSSDALKLLNFGQRNLKIASTKLNYQSSRSHCIFTIKVVRIADSEKISYAKVSRLSFCDLAGSERAAKSQTTGLRLKEAGCINTSLLVLGRCLEQLRLNPSLRDKKRIPFRESKLTRLLSGFFMGRGKAVMITNASPCEVTFDETVHALRFSALATELIINDSYITTASNTLQTITNMWTNARGNVSTSSDRSINFEDSTVEALQEKDELIEKLLDLAESLTNNLEKEKREKAELEIKIRGEVCQEYSEYSDELLECQKKNYEEEQEAIREIYKKRISAMEKMYENIIKDLKLQLEDSDTSCDEATDDTNSNAIVNGGRKSTISEKSFKGEAKDNIDVREDDYKNNFVTKTEGFLCDMEALKEDLETISKELKKTKDELEKSKDYCLALESATEEMEKKLGISNSNLEKALTENGELKIKIDYLQASYEDTFKLKKEKDNQSNKASDFEILKEEFENIKSQLENTLKINEDLKIELDALKIDCLSYKVDNNDLFKKKIALEEQLKSLSEELASTKSQKEGLCQKLSESEKNVADLGKEAKTLLERTNELTKSLEESKAEYEKSLEEAKKRAKEAEEVMISVNQTLDSALTVSEEQKEKLLVLENECACLREKNAGILKKNKDLEEKYTSLTEELESEKSKVHSESFEVEKTLQEIEKVTKELDTVKSECVQYEKKVSTLQETNLSLEGKVSSLLEELVSEKAVYKQELDTLNCRLNGALSALEKEKEEVEKLLESNGCLQNEIRDLQESNNELKDKLSIQTYKTESEVLSYKEDLDIVNSKLIEALSALGKEKKEVENLTNVINLDKNDIAELQKQNKELLDNMNSPNESEALDYKKELDDANSKLVDALSVLNKQKQEIDDLKNVINSDKNEIVQLQKQNKELQNNMNSQTESETMDYKKELDDVNSKLDEALSALDKQKQEVENLTNVINSDKNAIADLQKQNEELQESLDCKELDTVYSKLDEALTALAEQKQEVETLTNVINSDKKVIAELQMQNKELQDSVNSETEANNNVLKQELLSVNDKLEDALSTIGEQKEELENRLKECDVLRNKIADLLKTDEELKEKINSQGFQTDILHDLINVLEKCEMQATHKMNMMQSNMAKFNDENENLKEKLKKNSDDQENEYNNLHKLIQILQQCEVFASNKMKELHTSSIKQVEQIMDLEKCFKDRDASFETLKNDYNLLQKQLKDLQTASKNQLQTEKLHRSEIDNLKNEKNVVEKENKTLKYQVTQLEGAKDRFETEVKNMKTEFEKVLESKNQVVAEKEKLIAEVQNLKTEVEKIAEEKKKICQASAEKEKLAVEVQNPNTEDEKITEGKKNVCEDPNMNEESKTGAKKTYNKKEKTEKKSRQKSKEKNENEQSGKNQDEKRTKSNEKSEVISEDEKSKTVIYEEEEKSDENSFEKRTRRKIKKQPREVEEKSEKKTSKNVKNRGEKRKTKSSEKSEIISEDKKSKTIIYEETDESSNSENAQKVRNSSRREMRTVENVTNGLGLVNNKDMSSTKSKLTKRKELSEAFEDKLHDKKILKKMKLQDINEIENISSIKKPQNLRIQLLKANIPTNDIPVPSPRMTRGRKRLCNLNAKENTSLSIRIPRTLRS